MQTSNTSTTKMTSKGQVVIPEDIRDYMELESGTKFVVVAVGDSIIFKKIQPIPEEDIKELLAESRKVAKKYNFKKYDLDETIAEVRAEKQQNKIKPAKKAVKKIMRKTTKKVKAAK